MTSETEALCRLVSEFRGEWAITQYICECGHTLLRHISRGLCCFSEGKPAKRCQCKEFIEGRQPLDWTLPENAWRLLDSIRRQGYYEVRMTADMLSLVPTDDAPAEIVQGVFMDLDAEISLEEAAVWLYAKAHGLTTSTEGR